MWETWDTATRWTFVVLLLGSGMTFLPYPLWWLLWGWRHKGKEPADELLIAFRMGGCGVILLALLLWSV